LNTRRFYMLGFGALMLFDTLTQISFKLATGLAGEFSPHWDWLTKVFFNPWIYGAVAGYLGAFITWMTLLKHAPIGPAFAASHLEVVTVLIISVMFFGEHLSLIQMVGGLSIVLGILCLSMSESKNPHA
jgi:drug/metabolite transporter (DMT)-like permease